MDNFNKRKKDILDKADKSFIGKWDKKIIGLCGKINKKKDYYTTSSCSGRVVLVKDLVRKEPGVFLWVSHDLIKFDELKREVGKLDFFGGVRFKQEPCILHIACRNLGRAQNLVDSAKLAGWKRSGIITSDKRFVVELMSTEKLELPIISKGKILVDENYLKVLVKKSNENLLRVWKKIEELNKKLS